MTHVTLTSQRGAVESTYRPEHLPGPNETEEHAMKLQTVSRDQVYLGRYIEDDRANHAYVVWPGGAPNMNRAAEAMGFGTLGEAKAYVRAEVKR